MARVGRLKPLSFPLRVEIPQKAPNPYTIPSPELLPGNFFLALFSSS
jgi:hypothetical protein